MGGLPYCLSLCMCITAKCNLHEATTIYNLHEAATKYNLHEATTKYNLHEAKTKCNLHEATTKCNLHEAATKCNLHKATRRCNLHKVEKLVDLSLCLFCLVLYSLFFSLDILQPPLLFSVAIVDNLLCWKCVAAFLHIKTPEDMGFIHPLKLPKM